MVLVPFVPTLCTILKLLSRSIKIKRNLEKRYICSRRNSSKHSIFSLKTESGQNHYSLPAFILYLLYQVIFLDILISYCLNSLDLILATRFFQQMSETSLKFKVIFYRSLLDNLSHRGDHSILHLEYRYQSGLHCYLSNFDGQCRIMNPT